MLFQALDDKKECVGVYARGELFFEDLPKTLTQTWSFSPSIDRDGIEFAKIFINGKTLSCICPEHLKQDYEKANSKMLSFYKSFVAAKVSLEEHCFYDLVPKRHLLEYFSIKSQICEWIFENYQKPANHDFLVKVSRMISDISFQKFKIDKAELNRYLAEERVRSFRKKVSNEDQRVVYDAFGTVTGRLTVTRDSFPILTLDKKFRNIVKPKNDWLVEIDYNAAELRTLMGLSGNMQPKEDLHQWNVENIYNNEITREQAKERFFAWLYNPESIDKSAEKFYSRNELVKKYYSDGAVRTPMGRNIEVDPRRALNYLIQSTSSDIFLNNSYEVWKMLEGRSSEIRFLVHDSILLDLSDEDREHLPKIIDKFSQTPLGAYKVGVSIGKSYGEMRKIK